MAAPVTLVREEGPSSITVAVNIYVAQRRTSRARICSTSPLSVLEGTITVDRFTMHPKPRESDIKQVTDFRRDRVHEELKEKLTEGKLKRREGLYQ